MINVGDTVKVIGKTLDGSGEEVELIPIGTICRVEDVDDDENGRFVEIIPINRNAKDGYISHWGYWYLEKDLEKGHMEWVKDK